MMIFLDPHKSTLRAHFRCNLASPYRDARSYYTLGRTNYTVPVTTHSAQEVLNPNQELNQFTGLGNDKFQVMKHSPMISTV